MKYLVGGIAWQTQCVPALDPGFIPLAGFLRAFRSSAGQAGGINVKIAVEREDGLTGVYETRIHGTPEMRSADEIYIERTVKTLLWAWGGWRVLIGGNLEMAERIGQAYRTGGAREFDAEFMARIYERPFMVENRALEAFPAPSGSPRRIGRHTEGCRIGFDAGGSMRKVSAVVGGKAVWTEEMPWSPMANADPEYHFSHIVESLKRAAAQLPRVDAVGISSAGVFVANRTMVASLFRGVGEADFNAKVRDIYIRAAGEIGDVALEVANDGDVTALAGAMELGEPNVLGIAMGTSQAGGFVDAGGNITGWLNELAFVPLDLNPGGAVDDWSGDVGCGVKYLSQDGAVRLAAAAGIQLDKTASASANHRSLHALMEQGDERAALVYQCMGCYLGHALAHYYEFFGMRHVLLMGGVVAGKGGGIILDEARRTLQCDYHTVTSGIALHLPAEDRSRRVGLSVAAASLPDINCKRGGGY